MAKNPQPGPMTDATNNDSAHNHGFETTAGKNGQKILRAYGMDRSTMAGTEQDERSTERGFKGGTDNLKHSLGGGVSANQTGQSRR